MCHGVSPSPGPSMPWTKLVTGLRQCSQCSSSIGYYWTDDLGQHGGCLCSKLCESTYQRLQT
ncbi:hypothetical protein Patl1_35628 [Pistacia atlantica]|nr:hypothetical protein Patl1_35628 [Pistacia atlantica]